MTPTQMKRLDRQLTEYLASVTEGLGRTERRGAMQSCVTDLLLEGERKSIEPMAARLVEDAAETEAMRQRLQQCVAHSKWDDAEVRRRLALKFDAQLPGLEALVVDDTGFPKKGEHSVGVARQYSGTLGRTDNCQVAVSLHVAGETGSGCVGMQLYLPQEWTDDRKRCRVAGVPEEVGFQRKWELALGLLDEALSWGVRRHVLLADAGYGDCRQFREAVRQRGLHYLVAVNSAHTVWPPEAEPQPPFREKKPGRPRTRYFDANGMRPITLMKLAASLSPRAFRTVRWRDGSRGVQSSRFAAVRVRTAENHQWKAAPSEEVWLLIEWPRGEEAPTKFHLCSLPEDTPLRELVRLSKLRWRVERDYQEFKGEVGLDHSEGRTWRGFHHHVTLSMVAHGFLALQRARFPPGEDAVDAARGAPAHAGAARRADWALPSLHAQHRSSGPPATLVEGEAGYLGEALSGLAEFL